MDQAETYIRNWEQRGGYHEVAGHRVFAVSQGNTERLPILFLHGYPSCSLDFRRVFDRIGVEHYLVVHDHPGFGFSHKPLDYSYSLMDQARAALQLWEQLGIREAHLVAHDYGTSVATEILALREEGGLAINLRTVTLSNGSVHIELARLRLIQKLLKHRLTGPVLARLSNRIFFRQQMRSLWYDRKKCDMDELEALWRLLRSRQGFRVLPVITRYLDERYQYWDRWIGALERLDIPAHILWAQDDPVAVKAIGEQLWQEIPGARITRLEHLGHYPMLEDPGRWTDALMEFIHKNAPV